MRKTTTLIKFLIINLLLAVLDVALPAVVPDYAMILFYFAANISVFFTLCAALSNDDFAGRKKALFIIVTTGSVVITVLAIKLNTPAVYFLLSNCMWMITTLGARRFANATARALYRLLNKNMRVGVIGYNHTSAELAERIKKKARYSFQGFFDNEEPEYSIINTAKVQPVEYYLDLAKQKKITDLYVSSPQRDDFETLVQKAENYCIRINLIHSGEELHIGTYKPHIVSGIPVLRRYNEPLRQLGNRVIKRGFDICISSFVIIFVLSWFIPLVGLLIKLDSKGTVFFKQFRSGRDNDAFLCYKFRSMKKNAETDIQQATKTDWRITRVGAFLRKTSMDELPQFINVFKGNMSIVGPRPHMLLHTQEYSKQVSNYMVRLYLKPGITGWAQAKGYRGEITDIELMKKRVEHDIWYLEHWSLWLDIKILWLTFISVMNRKGNAY